MTKIKNTFAYPFKKPVATDFVTGSDSDNNGETVSFNFQDILSLINSMNGSEIVSYTFAISPFDELDENGYGYFLSENNETNPDNITSLILSKQTKSGIDLTDFFTFMGAHKNQFTIQLRNLSDPNNFIYLNIEDLTEQEFQFTMDINVYASDLFIGDLIDKNVYVLDFDIKTDTDVLGTILEGIDFSSGAVISDTDSVLLGFGKLQRQITDTIASLSTKLDKGGYSGTAQNLKTDIDNIYQPNILISSVSPTRVTNTFTYPANQYQALINKTIRTNPADFVTTITAAATDYKRVDLIYFKDDNTIDKIIGVESLTVAARPDIPANSVAISFINVFGNVISDPTPVLNEISFQDNFGQEKFRVPENGYVRWKGATLDSTTKTVSIDPLVPLSAFLDITNGNDTTALLENSNKPFRTIQALLTALPVTTGETYNIYITGGTVSFTRRVAVRNLRFIAYKPTTLDFTNCMENDGVTNAAFVLNETGALASFWYFENKNISIISNYVGNKEFNGTLVSLIGTIDTLEWRSRTTQVFQSSFNIRQGSNINFINVRDSSQNTIVLISPGVSNIVVDNFYSNNSRTLSGPTGTGSFMEVKNVIGNNNTVTIGNAALASLRIGAVLSTTSLAVPCLKVEFYGTINSTCQVDLSLAVKISGTLDTVLYAKADNVNAKKTFENFNGKINDIQIIKNGSLDFMNSNVTVNTNLFRKYVGAVVGSQVTDPNLLFLRGTNNFTQTITTGDLITFEGVTNPDRSVIIHDYGTGVTNATSWGTYCTYIKESLSFKEKSKEIVIRSKKDLLNRTLDSMTTYIIDGVITLLSGEYIEIPSGGLTINGYGFTPSAITKNIAGQSIFTSAVGGSGDVVSINVSYYPGLGSIFNISDSNGTHAIELDKVNFQGVTGSSLGTISGYRQMTGTTCGFYNLSDGLVLEGNWSGIKITNSNVIGFGASGTLFKKGTATVFSNRFYIDLNLQIATGSKICDFADTNFTNDKSLQVVNCYTKVNGVIDDTTTGTTFPNITPYSAKSYFVNNIGIKNSNNTPYGISTINMQTYANDAAAASGGIVQVGETYIETSTGYFKKRLT